MMRIRPGFGIDALHKRSVLPKGTAARFGADHGSIPSLRVGIRTDTTRGMLGITQHRPTPSKGLLVRLWSASRDSSGVIGPASYSPTRSWNRFSLWALKKDEVVVERTDELLRTETRAAMGADPTPAGRFAR